MLSKKNRADKKIVDLVYVEGKSIFSPVLGLRYLKNNSLDKRISFVVPKSVSKKAVDRNLLKRRGYLALERQMGEVPFGFWGVFLFGKKSFNIFGCRKNKKNNPINKLENEIKILINKIY